MADAGATGSDTAMASSARAGLAAGDPKHAARVFRALLARADDTVFAAVAADGHVRYVSPSVERLFGFSAEEYTGACMRDRSPARVYGVGLPRRRRRPRCAMRIVRARRFK